MYGVIYIDHIPTEAELQDKLNELPGELITVTVDEGKLIVIFKISPP